MYIDLSRVIDTEPLVSDVLSLISDEDLIDEINKRCIRDKFIKDKFIIDMMNSLDDDTIDTIAEYINQ